VLKAHILLLATLAIFHPVSVSAATNSQEYLPISVRSYYSFASDYTTLQTYYTRQSLPLIQAKIEEDKRIAEEKQRQEQEAEQARLAAEKEAARIKAAASVKVSLMNFASFDYETLIRERCNELGCNAEQIIRVMYCESGGRANAVNRGGSGASGLFQFMPGTFNGYARRLGMTGANIWNPRDQIIIATYMFANGGAHHWSCK
jgi:soluble lytic murein transglycosylase-like protein